MIVLYINGEHCTSLAQLKGFFHENPTPGSEVYADLLDYGRYGDIAKWLREMGEVELSTMVDSIASDLSDHVFYARLKAIITGSVIIDSDADSLKPAFNKCFSFEDLKCEVKDGAAKVFVSLNIRMCVNEKYELSVSTSWGTLGMMINPYDHPQGRIACFEFSFRRRPDKDVGDFTVMEVFSLSIVDSSEFLVGDVRFKMIHVEGGTFTRRAINGQLDPACDDRHVKEHVTLSGYYIGETPVTQELWQAVMDSNPSTFEGLQLPVEGVSRDDCLRFIQRLNQETGKQFHLPTLDEWEFAARGGLKSASYQYSGGNDIDEVAWYIRNSGGKTHLVKTKKPNELGIYDMSGNVWEYCESAYGNYDMSCTSKYSCGRGGAWDDPAETCRSTYPYVSYPIHMNRRLGLRLALSESRTSLWLKPA